MPARRAFLQLASTLPLPVALSEAHPPVVDTYLHCFASTSSTESPYHKDGPYEPPDPSSPGAFTSSTRCTILGCFATRASLRRVIRHLCRRGANRVPPRGRALDRSDDCERDVTARVHGPCGVMTRPTLPCRGEWPRLLAPSRPRPPAPRAGRHRYRALAGIDPASGPILGNARATTPCLPD
jgi:hypothetical protein